MEMLLAEARKEWAKEKEMEAGAADAVITPLIKTGVARCWATTLGIDAAAPMEQIRKAIDLLALDPNHLERRRLFRGRRRLALYAASVRASAYRSPKTS